MSQPLRFPATFLVLLGSALIASAAQAAPALERGAAITDPLALRELDRGRFGLERVMLPQSSADAPLANEKLFTLPSMVPVRKALDGEYASYIARHKTDLPNETIGVGTSFDFQLFDPALLYSADTRFVLSGIVNRMDRAFLNETDCGEVRLLYRLTRTDAPPAAGEGAVSPRLPMTLNVVLKAKGDHDAVSCAEIARRWLTSGDLSITGAALAEKLTAKDGPLNLIHPEYIDRIETNLQIAHAPKSPARDFRTDYLLKVFRYDAAAQQFVEAPLEDQIDRTRMLADAKFAREFKDWLLEPAHFAEFDRGTVLIPDKFLTTGTIAATPVGFSNSNLQPAFGLVQGDEGAADPLFKEADIVAALKRAAQRGDRLQNVRSVAGFARRLNDMSCSGCHQSRGIGGFHFPGVDWMAAKPDNAVVVPASPHFFGDQVRRRDILVALRDGKRPDYSRGFSSRPQSRGSSELAGSEYQDGWGAHCYLQHDAGDNDPSFKSWTCADGLACHPLSTALRMGMCFVK
jgi:hypothetical protein